MEININIPCTVTLTKFGADHLNKYFAELASWSHNEPSRIYKEDDEFETPLWDIMCIFGKTLYMGTYDLPFKENVIDLSSKVINEIIQENKGMQ